MPTIKELLSAEELKKLAVLFKKDERRLEEIGLEEAKKELSNQKQLVKEADDVLNIDNLIAKLNTLNEQDWKDSFQSKQSSDNNCYPIIADNDNNNRPMLLELNGDKTQRQDTLNKLKAAYREITGKDPQTKTYKNAEELPENLKALLSNKSFPLSIATFRFDNLKQLNLFHKVMDPLVEAGKIKVTEITPQNAAEAQEENASRPTFKP